jgi:hypothetical protein
MSDVKIVTRWALNIWALSAILVIGSAALLFYFREKSALRSALLGGSGLDHRDSGGDRGLFAVQLRYILHQFHQVFFESSTWTFLWSDSLIRLFPLTFWEDSFIFVGGGAIVEALVVAAWAWWGSKVGAGAHAAAPATPSLSLGSPRPRREADRFLIGQITMRDRPQVSVQLVEQRGYRWGCSAPESWSEMLSRYFTSARKLLPCAAISTRWPEATTGAMVLCQ